MTMASNFNTPSAEHSLKPLIFSVCKADNSGSDRPSASAAADVRLISLRFSSSRVLCLIAATNPVTASTEYSVRPRIVSDIGSHSKLIGNCKSKVQPSRSLIFSVSKADNSGSDWPSSSAATGVRWISLSSSISRVLCLMAATNFDDASLENLVEPLMLNIRRADNSGSDWPSAVAAPEVRLILLSSSSSRVLCLIAATSPVTASSEQSAKPLIFSVCKADNSGSDWLSASAAAEVRCISLSSSFSRVVCFIAETSLATASSKNVAMPVIFSVRKADNSGSHCLNASAADDVRLILRISRCSRDLCLTAKTNVVTASVTPSVKPLIISSFKLTFTKFNCKLLLSKPRISRFRKADNSGSEWPRAWTMADVTLISVSSSSSRVLFLIAATNFFNAP